MTALIKKKQQQNPESKLYSSNVTGEIGKVDKHQDVESYLRREKDEREVLAADRILLELKDLLLHSQRRGLSTNDSFAHFDESHSGAVSLSAFIKGLALLGIGVTKRVGELVIQAIGGAFATFLTPRDFADLLSQSQESSLITSTNRSVAVDAGNNANRSKMTAPKQKKRQQNPELQAALQVEDFPSLSLAKKHPKSDNNNEYTDSEKEIQDIDLLRQSGSVRRVVDGISFVRKKRGALNRRGLEKSGELIMRGKEKGRRRAWAVNSSIEKDKTIEQGSTSLLSSIAQEILDEQSASECSDELLHLDDGIVLTYRVLMQTKPKRSNVPGFDSNVPGFNSNVSGFEDMFNSEEVSRESAALPTTPKTFTLVVIPDLCMTLDTLQFNLESLLLIYPFARLVLVGLPGLPNTLWPSDVILDPELHSKCIGRLLLHLHTSHRLTSLSSIEKKEGERGSIFLMGFGTGAYSLLRFVSLVSPDLQWLEVTAAFIVNSVIKLNKTFKKICAELYHKLSGGSSSNEEMGEVLCSLHLWEDYLISKGKKECMERFWSVRKDLCSNQREQRGKEVSYVGILEQLRGLLLADPEGFDGASVLLTKLPVVVVQATEDVFVNPRGASVFQSSQMPPERFQVDNISDCLTPGAVHISWLKAGHEVLQEKNSFLLSLIGRLVQASGVSPAEEMKPIQVLDSAMVIGDTQDSNVDVVNEESSSEPDLDNVRSMLDEIKGGLLPPSFLHTDQSKRGIIGRSVSDQLTSSGPSRGHVEDEASDQSRSPSVTKSINSNNLVMENDNVISGLPAPVSLEKRRKPVDGSKRISISSEGRRRDLKATARAAVDRRRLILEQEQEVGELSAMRAEDASSIAVEAEKKRYFCIFYSQFSGIIMKRVLLCQCEKHNYLLI